MVTPICPKCSAALRDDYGMVACAGCGAIVFIDMDGVAHMSSEESANPPPSAQIAPQDQISAEDSTPTNFQSPMGLVSTPTDESAPEAGGDLGISEAHSTPSQFETIQSSDEAVAQGFSLELSSPGSAPEVGIAPFENSPNVEIPAVEESVEVPPLEVPTDAPAETTTEGPAEINEDFADFFGETEKPQRVSPAVNPKDPLGVRGYAENELSQAKGGGLLFKLRISGIDSKELREEIRQALKDSRFGWSLSEVMGPDRLRVGVLVITNLNAVKTSIIVNRIKHLPVEIRWEQYAITDLEGPTS